METREILISEKEYPQCLKNLKNPPGVIYVAGELLPRDFNGITVVGSRNMTSYGEAVVESIVGELVMSGLTVVSGLAFGVDVKSHDVALKLKGRTVAVLGSGIENITPFANSNVGMRIVEEGRGAIISTYEPTMPAAKEQFIERDYVMAALSRAVLVVEASEHSGTTHTVSAALEMGKEVFVVPGEIFSPYSAGCNRYIKEGATLVTCAGDILGVLGGGKARLRLDPSASPQDDSGVVQDDNGQVQDDNGQVQDDSGAVGTGSRIESGMTAQEDGMTGQEDGMRGDSSIKETPLTLGNELHQRIYAALTVKGVLMEDLCEAVGESVSAVLPAVSFMEVMGLLQVRGERVCRGRI